MDIKENIKAFNTIDKNMDGYITIEELERGMGSTTLVPSQTKDIMNHVDTDHNNAINYNEFIAATLNDKTFKNAFSINKAFDFFDKDKNGEISIAELQTVLQSSGINRLETDMIKDILLECDINGDGIIDKEEFFR
mmetsp:Transcript_13866/g.12284  ORF Transcript_13866/g.12284 Transcript_13866/m.12284 type:complete len:136 (+) Transcript_13866:118-525(+)